MSLKWNELVLQQPRELILTGEKGAKQVAEDSGLNDLIFRMRYLNFLEVSRTGLASIPAKVDSLTLLTRLALQGNKLTALPPTIGNLVKLKFLDVSHNLLETLPEEISNLVDLQSLIATDNKLTFLPTDMSKMTNLLVVKLGQNEMTSFPESICDDNLKSHLVEIHAQRNQINNIPVTINRLAALKVLDLSENSIVIIPGELGDCLKLKDVNLKGNKVGDRRLLKLIEQNKAKQVMDYIRAHCPRQAAVEKAASKVRDGSADRKGKPKDARRRRRSSSQSSEGDGEITTDTIKILPVKEDNWFLVTVTPAILEQRKIVCCIVRNVSFEKEGSLKRFLSLQTGLHEGICDRRQSATIAAHDFSKIEKSVTFDVKPPSRLKLVPLHRNKEMTAAELYKQLNDEAENLRKEKKRATYSGVHKYLYLLKGKQRYPCLYDYSNTIISFPPITNSETTKMTTETKDLFLEVTGESQPMCKKVMDALLHGMLKLGLGVNPAPTPAEADGHLGPLVNPHLLEVEPVKVVDLEGKLYVVYPSRVDLNFEDIDITRE